MHSEWLITPVQKRSVETPFDFCGLPCRAGNCYDNAGVTYQRVMVTILHDMIHKKIKVYVDDLIVKSQEEESHVGNLWKLFERLKKFQLKLNPAKCTFGATSGKLLGSIVSRKGIEVDPDKIKAIQNLPPPRTQKEVRGFFGRLNYNFRFISQMTAKCDPISNMYVSIIISMCVLYFSICIYILVYAICIEYYILVFILLLILVYIYYYLFYYLFRIGLEGPNIEFKP